MSTRLRLAQAIKDIGAVGKDKEITGGYGYAYRSSEAVSAAVHRVIADNGLFCTHRQKIVADELIATGNGKTTRRIVLEVKWLWQSEDQDWLTCVTYGEGLDQRDKGIQKAFTAAQKDMLVKTFCLSDSEIGDAEQNNEPAYEEPALAGKELSAEWFDLCETAQAVEIDGNKLTASMLNKAGVNSPERMAEAHLQASIERLKKMIEEKNSV